MKISLYVIVLLLVGALLWVELSIKMPVLQSCLDAGFNKYECADPTVRAIVVAQKKDKEP